MTTKDKEQMIVGVLINANREMIKYLNESKNIHNKELKNLSESKVFNIYERNFMHLYNMVNDTDLYQLNESIESPIVNRYNNYYAYFSNVLKFLDAYELPIQHSLNESLIVDNKRVNNPTQLDIRIFKQLIRKTVETMNKQNDVINYDENTLGIKLFAKQPLFVNGFNISDTHQIIDFLRKEGQLNKLFGIAYCKSNKTLYFVGNGIISYCILTDEFSNTSTGPNVNATNYIEYLKTVTGYNTIIRLWTDSNSLGLKYTDNLYRDAAYQAFIEKLNRQRETIIKL